MKQFIVISIAVGIILSLAYHNQWAKAHHDNTNHTVLAHHDNTNHTVLAQAQSDLNHGCLDCHDMHQYNNPDNTSMLRDTNIVQLCQSCHEDSVTHGKLDTQYTTCIECHNQHDIQPLTYEVTCLSCHDGLERKGKHKVDAKCFKCHKHLKGFSKAKK